jgi:hypothetical protein
MMLTKDRPEMAERAIAAFERQTYPNRSLFDSRGWVADQGTMPIGQLRNMMCSHMPENCLVAHWDDDDWSAPDRLEQQVMVLMANPHKAATGFRSMMFWDTERREAWHYEHPYRDYILGTSLMYRHSAWRAKPFEHTSRGEDTRWITNIERIAFPGWADDGPMMLGRIHPGNTSDSYALKTRQTSLQWTRAGYADATCAAAFEKGGK